jgi:carbon storage regulator CsrA
MLVLKRKPGESIEIQIDGMEPIEIAILRVDHRDNVCVGVRAPREVVVHRQEIADKIRNKGEVGNSK